MKFTIVLAHGPSPFAILGVAFAWMLLAYGLPAVAWAMVRKRRKIPGLLLGCAAFGITAFASFSKEFGFGGELSFFPVFLGFLPLLFSIVVVVQSIRILNIHGNPPDA